MPSTAGGVALLLAWLASGNAIRFVDVTRVSGITFRHRHGGGGDKHMMETMSGGAGFWDYDGDGDLDIYLLNGAPLPGYAGPLPLTNTLYRNDGGRFSDVTSEAGLLEEGYTMGLVAADYDDDGDLDLYLTSFGKHRLYRNNGDGTFFDVADAAGVGHEGFGASAAFADVDGDSDLDLYATRYLDYRLEETVFCGNKDLGIRTYCHPDNYDGAADVLYRNEGDGTFTDVSQEAGIALAEGKGLGVIFLDFDGDGDSDIYVANDSVMNFFFVNDGRGRFQENALAMGVGFNEEGRAEAGMGVDAADYDADGKLDLFVTNFESETNTLYRNLGDGTFVDATFASGLGLPSLPWIGFGTAFFDVDSDGDPDLFTANGHIVDDARFLSDATRYRQPNQLFENVGGRFVEISESAGEPFAVEQVSRGAAFGDWDDDGDPDILVVNNDDVPNFLRNETENANHWTLLRLVGRRSNRDGIGARVTIESGGRVQIDELRSGTSYLSQNDLRLHFGLGGANRIDRLEIRWPSGETDRFDGLPADRILLLREGGAPEVLGPSPQ